MSRQYSTAEAAEVLGVTPANVSMMCSRYEVPKFGSQYVIDEDTLEFLRSRKGKKGRPKGSPNKSKAHAGDPG